MKTAQLLGYPVPCPIWLPQVVATEPDISSCLGTLVSPVWLPGCGTDPEWRGWMAASGGIPAYGHGASVFSDQHFAMESAPFATSNYDLVANGPIWDKLGRPRTARALDWITVGGQRMRFVMVPDDTPGSSMAGHLALVWTAGSHTYTITFHVLWGVPLARALDIAVAQRLVMIAPPVLAPRPSTSPGGLS